jgi:PAS domain S-box-containing protein
MDPTWLASLLDASGAALVAVDTQGRTIFWSRGAQAVFGWASNEVLGQPPPIVPASLSQEWQLQLQRVLDTGEPTPAAETQRQARDGRLIPVLRSSSPLRGPDGCVLGLLDTLTDVTAHKQLDDESRALAQVRERELIAMDLHDGLIQSLYGLVLTLDARQRELEPSETAAQQALQAARLDIERVLEETRSYVFDLQAREFAPRNLGAGLQILADGLRLNAGIDVELQFDPAVEQFLPPEARAHVVYLAREAISNALRHAQATQVAIKLTREENRVVLTIVDNGRGFDNSTTMTTRERSGRHGLRNMAERARLVGGRLEITSHQGEGTQVRLAVPSAANSS